MTRNPLYVTQPFLPPLQEVIPYLENIWDNKVLTNGGPMHKQLEEALCDYLGVKYISLFSNGTIALLTAIQALGFKGEVITTPYSFVATSHALLWNNATPVFVDIDPDSLNIDPKKIEAAITPQTTGILAVHCYGQPCDTGAIQQVANRHGLKVIYDAAHAFGVRKGNESILNHGDLSVLSLHATKVFNTFEGGAIICHDLDMKSKIDELKNFGIVDDLTIIGAGLNGKMNEFSAAVGLAQLKYIDECIIKRRSIDCLYREKLKNVSGVHCLNEAIGVKDNFAYFPILIKEDFPRTRDELFQDLKSKDIYARRYFYPLISDFSVYRDLPSANPNNLPVASDAAGRVLCLPIFPDLNLAAVDEICDHIASY